MSRELPSFKAVDTEPSRVKVFVYGTLKEGGHNRHWLAGSDPMGAGVIRDKQYIMRNLGAYPALQKSDDGDLIFGEIHAINTDIVAQLDRLEGYPDLYDREWVTVEDEYGNAHLCLVYFVKEDWVEEYPVMSEGYWDVNKDYYE